MENLERGGKREWGCGGRQLFRAAATWFHEYRSVLENNGGIAGPGRSPDHTAPIGN